MHRREFLGITPAVVAGAAFILRRDAPIRIAFVRSGAGTVAEAAARMSAREVERTAQLVGREFSFAVVNTLRPAEHWSAVVLAAAAPVDLPASVAVVDIATERDMTCAPNSFHLLPTRAMKGAAVAAAQLGDADGDAHDRCVVWHSTLERFGAAQLNARFRAAQIDDPGQQAWLGWFAVKCLWESAVRSRSPGEMSFDGHKGQALYLGSKTRTLVQPLYVLSADHTRVLHEWRPTAEIEDSACAL